MNVINTKCLYIVTAGHICEASVDERVVGSREYFSKKTRETEKKIWRAFPAGLGIFRGNFWRGSIPGRGFSRAREMAGSAVLHGDEAGVLQPHYLLHYLRVLEVLTHSLQQTHKLIKMTKTQ